MGREEKEMMLDCYRKLYRSYLEEERRKAARWAETVEEMKRNCRVCEDHRKELEGMLKLMVDTQAITSIEYVELQMELLNDFSVTALYGACVKGNVVVLSGWR